MVVAGVDLLENREALGCLPLLLLLEISAEDVADFGELLLRERHAFVLRGRRL
jgi:hypothetical protein